MIRRAVEKVLSDPAHRTVDLGGKMSTTDMGARVVAALA
jgi:isocitrate/isopropylmalate dehydrogenase